MSRQNKKKTSEARVRKHNCVGSSANICNARKSGVGTEKKRVGKRKRESGCDKLLRGRRLFRRHPVFSRHCSRKPENSAAETFRADCTGVSLPLRLVLFVYYNLDTIISFSSSHASHRRLRRLFTTAALYLRSLLLSVSRPRSISRLSLFSSSSSSSFLSRTQRRRRNAVGAGQHERKRQRSG